MLSAQTVGAGKVIYHPVYAISILHRILNQVKMSMSKQQSSLCNLCSCAHTFKAVLRYFLEYYEDQIFCIVTAVISEMQSTTYCDSMSAMILLDCFKSCEKRSSK